MEQHPVPQPITSYEFRLVGDMTLKQFFKLAAGVLLALLVYAISPPGFLKWFLILLFTGLGLGMAFLPFEGRSIDVWIIAFFKRIYSPTQYIWRQKGTTRALPQTPPSPLPTAATVQSIPISKLLPTSPPPGASPPVPASLPVIPKPITETVLKAPGPAASELPKPKFVPPPPLPVGKKVDAKFVLNIVIPSTPTMPNLLTGFIHDRQGKIIEGAILEIRDSMGNPVRAFKTNKLGQFLSATPLPPGTYEIETEKEGYLFDIIKVELKGEILSPIEIVSK